MIKWMVRAISSGKMVLCMKANGLEGKNLARENSTGLTVKYTKENLRITSAMEPVYCTIRAERGLKDSGR